MDSMQERNQNELTSCYKSIWILFINSTFLELFITAIFWLLLYGGGKIYFHLIYLHGILLILVLLYGFAIHRFPVRLKQIIIILPISITYLAWTIIHSQTNIGNPNKTYNDPETKDDDTIYNIVNWNERPKETAI